MKRSPGWEKMVAKARSIDIQSMCAKLGVGLNQKGEDSFWGQCPFCKNETPNLHISPAKGRSGLYFCFDCRQGGDPLALFMEVRKQSFPEAVKSLGDT